MVGEEILDDDLKFARMLRTKKRKLGMDLLNKKYVSDQEMDELFCES